MSLVGDFVCALCGCRHWWIKQWTANDPAWYVLCAQCHELYRLMPDGTVDNVQIWEKA